MLGSLAALAALAVMGDVSGAVLRLGLTFGWTVSLRRAGSWEPVPSRLRVTSHVPLQKPC